jgi:hypothetical protein
MMPRSLPGASRRARMSRLAAALVILVGYVDLARGGTGIAPVALVAGYLVLTPLSLFID